MNINAQHELQSAKSSLATTTRRRQNRHLTARLDRSQSHKQVEFTSLLKKDLFENRYRALL